MAGSLVEVSSPLAAAFGSSTGSVAVRSNSRPIGAVSEASSVDENGRAGREVSSNSSAFHALGPEASALQSSTPTSVLGVLAMNTRCFSRSHARSAAMYRRPARSTSPNEGATSSGKAAYVQACDLGSRNTTKTSYSCTVSSDTVL